MSINVVAARTIALREDLSLSEKRAIMEMLGLVEVGGSEVLPDSGKGYLHPSGVSRQMSKPRPSRDQGEARELAQHSTAPAGLRASRRAAGDTRRAAGGQA